MSHFVKKISQLPPDHGPANPSLHVRTIESFSSWEQLSSPRRASASDKSTPSDNQSENIMTPMYTSIICRNQSNDPPRASRIGVVHCIWSRKFHFFRTTFLGCGTRIPAHMILRAANLLANVSQENNTLASHPQTNSSIAFATIIWCIRCHTTV
jgi:hypothetical protein